MSQDSLDLGVAEVKGFWQIHRAWSIQPLPDNRFLACTVFCLTAWNYFSSLYFSYPPHLIFSSSLTT